MRKSDVRSRQKICGVSCDFTSGNDLARARHDTFVGMIAAHDVGFRIKKRWERIAVPTALAFARVQKDWTGLRIGLQTVKRPIGQQQVGITACDEIEAVAAWQTRHVGNMPLWRETVGIKRTALQSPGDRRFKCHKLDGHRVLHPIAPL